MNENICQTRKSLDRTVCGLNTTLHSLVESAIKTGILTFPNNEPAQTLTLWYYHPLFLAVHVHIRHMQLTVHWTNQIPLIIIM